MYLIRLNMESQKKTKQVYHPVLDDAVPHTEEELQGLEGDDLVMALLSLLRHLVSRYCGNWAPCENHVDDMVSEGLEALTVFSRSPPETDIMRAASQKIRDSIELYLNKNRGLSAPSMRTQKYRLQKGYPPLYLESVEMSEVTVDAEDEGDIYKRDVMDVLDNIEARDVIEASILCKDNWGKTSQDLADMFGITRQAIQKKRSRLYNEYLNLTR